MKIYLMQHGEAKSRDEDAERSLSEQGRNDVEKMAGFINRSGINVNRIIHSGKLRAQQTAEIISSRILNGATEISHLINPGDDISDFVEEIDNTDDALFVVGHLPFLSKLVSFLVSESADQDILIYSPASIVCLQRDDNECWLINWMLKPELITD